MREYLKTGLILALFMIASALLVSVVYNFVNPLIQQAEFDNTLSAIEKVLKDAESEEYLISNIPSNKEELNQNIWKEDESGVLFVSLKNAKVYSPVYKFNTETLDVFVLTVSGVGYGGDVTSVISFVKEKNNEIVLNKIEVINYSQETPGLGARIAEDEVKKRFSLIPESGLISGVKVDKDAGVNIPSNSLESFKSEGVVKTSDVMTGATITPRAVSDSINAAVEFLTQEGVI
ncbi:electron transporter RnfG [Petrotoga sp. 9PW.55.5.1]|uniref:RnfABCDGE type electron transport complex subunit G n=1 Tax=Petrotoga sp. 9PW.55.5.1 TaxID=1308979 RepID=UPI000DC5E1CB|nr:RnfABCDGE type electron transport complex subunit G [Petrotoga sp. 9PW.55.5.1]RAO99064.1 electron transporter RnfG [Petrotoga sp. 9PW.55.5.1]